jgi:single-strand DNA-binding protein
MATRTAQGTEAEPVNEVRLVGRVSNAPERRELPSGDQLVSFRLVVDRPEDARRGRQRVDVLECVAWGRREQRTVTRWDAGDTVEVTGRIRRRFFSTGGGTGSRVEVEVGAGRLIRRSATA